MTKIVCEANIVSGTLKVHYTRGLQHRGRAGGTAGRCPTAREDQEQGLQHEHENKHTTPIGGYGDQKRGLQHENQHENEHENDPSERCPGTEALRMIECTEPLGVIMALGVVLMSIPSQLTS